MRVEDAQAIKNKLTNIEEVIAYKKALEVKVEQALHDFTTSTGLNVHAITFDLLHSIGCKTASYLSVHAEVHID